VRPIRRRERVIQQKFVALVRHFHPSLLFWHTPNGEDRDPRTAIVLASMGVKAGVPDLFFPELRLFIEFKAPGEGLSTAQVEVVTDLRRMGYDVLIEDDHERAFALIEGRYATFQRVHGRSADRRGE
jgi:hypothetical protein